MSDADGDDGDDVVTDTQTHTHKHTHIQLVNRSPKSETNRDMDALWIGGRAARKSPFDTKYSISRNEQNPF